jgi:glyoxylase-like metal-dependent hydrolase (beta-lactamase superfamily II)
MLAALALGFASAAGAQDTGARVLGGTMSTPPVVTTPRLYVLDCGTLTNDRPEDFGLKRDEVKYVNFANMCFLIVHPKGTLLWDTGLRDDLVGRPLYETMRFIYTQIKFNTLRGQLADLGYAPEQITYLSLSHSHFDHVGNANMFAKSTWLVEKPEWDAMFNPGPGDGPGSFAGDFKDLKTAKTVFVGPDYDVFGDGTVVIKQAFGHSPGHAVLAVKLRDTGNILLAGDLWHYPEELSLHRIGEHDAKTATPQAREAIEAWAKAHNAQIWGAHFMTVFAKARKSPGYYE